MLAPHRTIFRPGVFRRQRIWPSRAIASIAISFVVMASGSTTLAGNGTWTDTTTGGLWSNTANWSGGTIADGIDGIADFSTLNITANDTVHLDSARPIGQLKFGDTTPSNNWILNNNGIAADILTLAVSSGTPTITVNNQTATISAVLAGTQGLTLAGNGTLTLTGPDIYTGTTTINSGTLQVGSGGSLNGTTGTPLTFGGSGTFNFDEAANSAQGMGALAFSGGDGTVQSTFVGTNATLTFSSLAARTAGATGNFVNSGGTNGTTNSIKLTGALLGFIDQGTYFGGTSYAWMNAAGTYVRGISYNSSDAGTATSGAATSVPTVNHQQITGAISAEANNTFLTLKISGNNNFTLASGATVTVNGILKAGNSAGGATISGGTAIRAANNAELVIRTDGINDALTINTPIIANGSNSLTKSGAGKLTLSGANTYSGGTTVNAGTVAVQSGGSLTAAGNLSVGVSGQSGTFTIDGASSVTQAGAATVTLGAAAASTGTLNIGTTISGATFTTGTGQITINPASTVNIGSGSNTGTFNANGSVTINGGVLQRNDGSAFTLASGQTMTIQNGGRASFTGGGGLIGYSTASNAIYNVTGANSKLETLSNDTFRIEGGAQVNVTSGGTLASAYEIDIGAGTGNSGTLTVDGAGSSASVPGSSSGGLGWGNEGGTANVTYSNGAAGDFKYSDLYLGEGNTTGSAGTLNIQSGASVSVRGLFMANANGTQTAVVNISGAGSQLTQNSFNPVNGSLILGSATAGTGTINVGTIVNGGLFTSGTGAIQINATGTVNIGSGANSGTFNVNGNVTLNGGAVNVASGSSFTVAAGLTTTLNAGTFNINGGTVDLKTLTYNGGTVSFTAGSLSFLGNLTVGAGGLLGQNVTLDAGKTLTLSGTTTINSLQTLTLSNGTLNTGNLADNGTLAFANPSSQTYSGVISGSGAVTKSAAGTLTLSGANTYGGGTTISGGVLNVGSTENAGTSGPLGKSGTISFSGGTLQYSSANTFDYSSRFSTAANQAYSVDTNGQNVTWATALTSSSGSVTKTGAGTLTLSGANTYGGSTTIGLGPNGAGGTIQLGVANGLPVGTTLTFYDSGSPRSTLDLHGFSQTVAGLNDGGNSSGLVTDSDGAATFTLNNTTANFYYGLLTGSNLAFVKTGTGSAEIGGANTFGGGATVKVGAIVVTVSSATTVSGALGPSASLVTLGDTTGSANASILIGRAGGSGPGATGGLTLSNNITVQDGASGALTLGGQNTSGINTFGGNVALGSTLNTAQNVTLVAAPGGEVDFTGKILANGLSNGNVTVGNPSNTGTIKLLGANTYTGGTSVNNGKLFLGGSMGATAVSVAGGTAYSVVPSFSPVNGGASLTLSAGAGSNAGGSFDMIDNAIDTMNLTGSGTALTIGGTGTAANAPVVTFEIGNGSTGTDRIALNGGGTVAIGASGGKININALAGIARITHGAYTLISSNAAFPTGLTFSNGTTSATLSLGANHSTYNLTLGQSGNNEVLTLAVATPVNAYWSGAASSAWNSVGAGDATNWRTDAASNIDTQQIPGPSTNVFFSTSTPAPSNLTNTLGQDVSINSLTFVSGAAAATIGGGNNLTLAAGITNSSANAQTVNTATLTLGADQTFDPGAAAGGSLVIGTLASTLVNGGFRLTVTNSNPATINSAISGTGDLLKQGAATLFLNGNNTFTGPVNVNGGTLAQSGGTLAANVTNLASFVLNGGAFGGSLFTNSGMFTCNGGAFNGQLTNLATFTYNGGTFNGRLINAGTTNFNADFTAAGGAENDANLSIPSGRTITLNGAGLDNEGTLTLAGGTLALGAGITHSNQGEIDLQSGSTISLANGAMLTNNATLNLTVTGSTGGTVNGIGGMLVNKGSMFGPGTINSGFNNNGGTLIAPHGTTKVLPAFSNSGFIELTDVGSVLSGGLITNTGSIQGIGTINNAVTNSAGGTIEASSGGTLGLVGTLQNQAGGTLTAFTGSKLLVTTGLAANAGVVSLNGGTFDNSGQPLNNTGRISGFGIFRTGGSGLDNNGIINFSGGLTTVNGDVTNENGRTINVFATTIFNDLVINNLGGTINTVNTNALNPAEFVGGFTNNTSSRLTKIGPGVLEIASDLSTPFTLKDSSSLAINSGSMMLSIAPGGSATIGTGVTATVSNSATLELAGSVSNLSSSVTTMVSGSASPLAGTLNKANIINISSATVGLLVSGIHQIVGYITGQGTTVVGAGDDLTVNGIVGGSLMIGPGGLVTIGTSDAEGNPLVDAPLADAPELNGLTLASSLMPSNATAPDDGSMLIGGDPGASSIDNSLTPGAVSFGGGSAVPEPSSLLLAALAIGGTVAASSIRGSRRRPRISAAGGMSCGILQLHTWTTIR